MPYAFNVLIVEIPTRASRIPNEPCMHEHAQIIMLISVCNCAKHPPKETSLLNDTKNGKKSKSTERDLFQAYFADCFFFQQPMIPFGTINGQFRFVSI